MQLQHNGELDRFCVPRRLESCPQPHTKPQPTETNLADAWVVGLLVIALKTSQHFNDGASTLTFEKEKYFDSIFDKISETTQKHLMLTSLLPYIDTDHVPTLTENPDALKIIEAMDLVNLSFEMIYQKQKPYEYQPLLKQFLTTLANRQFSEEERETLSFRAASLFENGGDISSAVKMLIKSKNDEALVAFLERNADELVAENRLDLTIKILDVLPKKRKTPAHPWPNYWTGKHCLTSNPKSSRTHFKYAYDYFLESENTNGALLSWVGIVESIFFECRSLKEIPSWIDRFYRIVKDNDEFPTETSKNRVTAAMLTALMLTSKNYSRLDRWVDSANTILSQKPPTTDKILLLANLTLYHMIKGETLRAEHHKNLLADQLKTGHPDPFDRLRAELIVSIFLRMTANHQACSHKISECLKLSKELGVRNLDFILMDQKAASAISSGCLDIAEKQLKKMASRINLRKPIEACPYYFLKSRSHYLKRNYRDALYYGELALKLCIDARLSFFEGVQHISYSQILIGAGNLDKAEYYLSEAEKNNLHLKSRFLDYYMTLTRSHLTFRRGDEPGCFALLEKALNMSRKHEFYCSPLDSSHLHAIVFEKALQKEVEVRYVQDEIRKKKILPSNTAMLLENWPWNIKIYTMGRFSILEDGKPVNSRKKAQRKPMDMLKVLIALGGRQVSQDLIIDYLWPETEGDVARKSFATTLHRLRKKIGTPEALQLTNGCLTLSQNHCWVDVWAFERLVNTIDKLWEKAGERNASRQAIELSQKALQLYNGPFLYEHLNEPWTIFCRERIRNKFLRLIGKLGKYWEEHKELSKALECYQKSLEVDGFDEETYRRLMVCYKRMGLKTKALAVYNRCKKIMKAKFGVDLSEATEIVRGSITN